METTTTKKKKKRFFFNYFLFNYNLLKIEKERKEERKKINI